MIVAWPPAVLFLAKKGIKGGGDVHHEAIYPRRPFFLLDHLLFLFQEDCFLGQNFHIFWRNDFYATTCCGSWSNVSWHAGSPASTLHLDLQTFKFVVFFSELFYEIGILYLASTLHLNLQISLFVDLVNFFLGYRYVIFCLHAAPWFANILILMFMGYIMITMKKIYLYIHICWLF